MNLFRERRTGVGRVFAKLFREEAFVTSRVSVRPSLSAKKTPRQHPPPGRKLMALCTLFLVSWRRGILRRNRSLPRGSNHFYSTSKTKNVEKVLIRNSLPSLRSRTDDTRSVCNQSSTRILPIVTVLKTRALSLVICTPTSVLSTNKNKKKKKQKTKKKSKKKQKN